MKKRVLSLVLILVMVMSLAGCGTKETGKKGSSTKDAKNISEVVKAVEGVKANGVKVEASFNDMKFAFEAYKEGEDKALVLMSYNSKPVTEIIYVDKTLYMNATQLATFVDDLMVELGETSEQSVKDMLKQQGINKDYVSIKQETIEKIAEEYTDDIAVDLSKAEEMTADYTKCVEAFTAFVGSYVSSVEGKFDKGVITISGQYATINVNSDNIEGILKVLKDSDIKTPLTKLINDLKKIDLVKAELEELDVEEAVDSASEEFAWSIESAIEDVDSFKESKPEIKIGFGVKDKKAVCDMSIKATDGEETNSLSVKVSTTGTKKIKAPADSFDLTEIMEMLIAQQENQTY